MKLILISFLCILLITNTVTAAIPVSNLPSTLLDGTNLSDLTNPALGFVAIDELINYIETENIDKRYLYFRVVVPDDSGSGQWNLSREFMERKPNAILFPTNPFLANNPAGLDYWLVANPVWVYACCNITFGDLLYTANASNPDGSFNITLAGTLTNNYDSNWKTRVYNSVLSSWGNVNVGKAEGANAYNRRAILSSDGVFVGYAMQSINVTVPTLIKIYKV